MDNDAKTLTLQNSNPMDTWFIVLTLARFNFRGFQ